MTKAAAKTEQSENRPTPQGHLTALLENQKLLKDKIENRIPKAHYADEDTRKQALAQAKRQLKEVERDIDVLQKRADESAPNS